MWHLFKWWERKKFITAAHLSTKKDVKATDKILTKRAEYTYLLIKTLMLLKWASGKGTYNNTNDSRERGRGVMQKERTTMPCCLWIKDMQSFAFLPLYIRNQIISEMVLTIADKTQQWNSWLQNLVPERLVSEYIESLVISNTSLRGGKLC